MFAFNSFSLFFLIIIRHRRTGVANSFLVHKTCILEVEKPIAESQKLHFIIASRASKQNTVVVRLCQV